MGIFKFLKPPTHQQFSYKPRYWDPKKEESEQRAAHIRILQEGGVESMKERISGGFRRGAGGAAAGTYRNQRVKKANGTLFMVIIVLMVVSYFAIEVYFPDLSGWLETELPQPIEEGTQAPAAPIEDAPTLELEEL